MGYIVHKNTDEENFVDAIVSSNVSLVKSYIEEYGMAVPGHVNSYEFAAFSESCQAGNLDIVKLLLPKMGKKRISEIRHGWLISIYNEHYDISNFLLKKVSYLLNDVSKIGGSNVDLLSAVKEYPSALRYLSSIGIPLLIKSRNGLDNIYLKDVASTFCGESLFVVLSNSKYEHNKNFIDELRDILLVKPGSVEIVVSQLLPYILDYLSNVDDVLQCKYISDFNLAKSVGVVKEGGLDLYDNILLVMNLNRCSFDKPSLNKHSKI